MEQKYLPNNAILPKNMDSNMSTDDLNISMETSQTNIHLADSQTNLHSITSPAMIHNHHNQQDISNEITGITGISGNPVSGEDEDIPQLTDEEDYHHYEDVEAIAAPTARDISFEENKVNELSSLSAITCPAIDEEKELLLHHQPFFVLDWMLEDLAPRNEEEYANISNIMRKSKSCDLHIHETLNDDNSRPASSLLRRFLPWGKNKKKKVNITGIKVMIFCCIGSVTVVGLIFWIRNIDAPINSGRM